MLSAEFIDKVIDVGFWIVFVVLIVFVLLILIVTEVPQCTGH